MGGLRRKREGTVAAAYDFEGLGSIPEVRRLLEVAVVDTLSLENSIARSRALAYLAQVAVSCWRRASTRNASRPSRPPWARASPARTAGGRR